MTTLLIIGIIIAIVGAVKDMKAERKDRAPVRRPARDSVIVPTQVRVIRQSAASIGVEHRSEQRLYRKHRPYRKDVDRMRGNDAYAQALFAQMLRNPTVAAAFKGHAVPSLRLVNRHTSDGVHVGGSVKWKADGTAVLTVARDNLMPTTMLHELAHWVGGLNEGHSPSWSRRYSLFVMAVYPRIKFFGVSA